LKKMNTPAASSSVPPVSVEHIAIDETGVARLAGRRTKVAQIAMDKIAFGWDAEQIQRQYPHLGLSEIHAALAYYYDHQAEIDRQIAESKKRAEGIRSQTENRSLVDKVRERAAKT
jgi:uncharacterized protein (DUF433 family)